MKNNLMKLILMILFIVICLNANAQKTARDYLRKASKAYSERDYKEAESNFRQVIKMGVTLKPDFYYYYGHTLFKTKQYKKSVNMLESYIDTVPDGKHISDAKRLLRKSKHEIAKQLPKKDKKKKKKSIKMTRIPEMVEIPSGSFRMGSNKGSEDSKPAHDVKIKNDFAIGKFEVTFAQYDLYVKEQNVRSPKDNGWGRGNRPVINVSLHEALNYAKWLSKKTKRKFRLPTEAEWEYVARTGVAARLGFTDLMGLGDANCDGCRYFWENERTVPVGNYEPNTYGIYDLYGNVWEWTCSLYTRKYIGKELTCADKNEREGKTMAVRGGGWDSSNQILRSYTRFNNFPTYTGHSQGFRLAEDLD